MPDLDNRVSRVRFCGIVHPADEVLSPGSCPTTGLKVVRPAPQAFRDYGRRSDRRYRTPDMKSMISLRKAIAWWCAGEWWERTKVPFVGSLRLDGQLAAEGFAGSLAGEKGDRGAPAGVDPVS